MLTSQRPTCKDLPEVSGHSRSCRTAAVSHSGRQPCTSPRGFPEKVSVFGELSFTARSDAGAGTPPFHPRTLHRNTVEGQTPGGGLNLNYHGWRTDRASCNTGIAVPTGSRRHQSDRASRPSRGREGDCHHHLTHTTI